MGARWSETWVKARDEASCAKLSKGFFGPKFVPRVGVWVRASQEDFDSEVLCSEEGRAQLLGDTEELDPLADLVYLAMYDGPAGELCGSFLYEHRENGALRRALVYAPNDDMSALLWRRVEGEPEPWEAKFGAFVLGEEEPRVSEYELSGTVNRQVLQPQG